MVRTSGYAGENFGGVAVGSDEVAARETAGWERNGRRVLPAAPELATGQGLVTVVV